jgi:prepilin-type processing-associated H-X9-DG protein
MPTTRKAAEAFSRLDAVATLLSVTVLFGVMMPMLHAAQTDAARARCQDNMRKLAQAVQSFEQATGELPNGWYGPNFSADNPSIYSGWGVRLLPYLGQSALYDRYRWDKHYYDVENQPVVGAPLTVFQCPEAKADRIMVGLTNIQTNETFPDRKAATSDYNIPRGYMEYRVPRVDNRVPSALMGLTNDGAERVVSNIVPRMRLVTDGLSVSLMLTEQGGRPDYYIRGVKQPDPSKIFHAGFIGPWAGWGSNWARGTDDGKQELKGVGRCMINCNNGFGIYSFHAKGANGAFMDGSVRFLADDVETAVLFALLSRAGDEIVSADDY